MTESTQSKMKQTNSRKGNREETRKRSRHAAPSASPDRSDRKLCLRFSTRRKHGFCCTASHTQPACWWCGARPLGFLPVECTHSKVPSGVNNKTKHTSSFWLNFRSCLLKESLKNQCLKMVKTWLWVLPFCVGCFTRFVIIMKIIIMCIYLHLFSNEYKALPFKIRVNQSWCFIRIIIKLIIIMCIYLHVWWKTTWWDTAMMEDHPD